MHQEPIYTRTRATGPGFVERSNIKSESRSFTQLIDDATVRGEGLLLFYSSTKGPIRRSYRMRVSNTSTPLTNARVSGIDDEVESDAFELRPADG